MEAYREIIDSRKLNRVIKLPGSLKESDVEIIVLPVEKSRKKKAKENFDKIGRELYENIENNILPLNFKKRPLNGEADKICILLIPISGLSGFLIRINQRM